jgi:uncharacterized RDD family membrane protein YckC
VARLLDTLVLVPAFLVLAGVGIALAAPHVGPLFPKTNNSDSTASGPTPGIIWIYLIVLGAGFLSGLAFLAYETIATVRYGRTLGKAWMKIRPLRVDGSPLGWGRSLGRVALYWASGLFSYLGLLDPLWCLWDAGRQCLHDKVVDTIVIND